MNYEIRIRGHLDPCWQDWLAGLQIVQEPSGTTRLAGSLPDQAALFGVLLTIDRLGLPVLSLELQEMVSAPEETQEIRTRSSRKER